MQTIRMRAAQRQVLPSREVKPAESRLTERMREFIDGQAVPPFQIDFGELNRVAKLYASKDDGMCLRRCESTFSRFACGDRRNWRGLSW